MPWVPKVLRYVQVLHSNSDSGTVLGNRSYRPYLGFRKYYDMYRYCIRTLVVKRSSGIVPTACTLSSGSITICSGTAFELWVVVLIERSSGIVPTARSLGSRKDYDMYRYCIQTLVVERSSGIVPTARTLGSGGITVCPGTTYI